MSKAQLQEVYSVISDVYGVHPIDKRSSSILYVANIDVLSKIVEQLHIKYGAPTKDHSLLNHIEWRVRPDLRILIQKAESLDGIGTLNRIFAMDF